MKRKAKEQQASGNGEFLKKLREDSLNSAVDELVRKENENGRLPKGTMRQVISDLNEVGIVVGRDRLNYLRKKRMKEVLVRHEEALGVEAPVPGEVLVLPQIEHSTSTGTISSISGGDDELENNRKQSAGRPLGTSLLGQDKKNKKRFDCINEITNIYKNKVSEKNNSKSMNNYLKKLTIRLGDTTEFHRFNNFIFVVFIVFVFRSRRRSD